MSKFKLGALTILFWLLLSTFAISLCIASISPGYAGVVYNRNGGIEQEALGQGWHLVWPWEKVIEYPVSTETIFLTKVPHEGRKTDDSLWVNTRDGKNVNVDVTYAYHMSQEKLPHVFTKFRGAHADDIEWGFMKNELYRVTNDVTSQYAMMDLVGDKRPEINDKIFKAYREAMSADGIVVETCNLSRIEPDAATLQAIQSVVNAQNALRQAEVEKQQAEIEAQKVRISAQGAADAALIAAEGQAKANAKLQQSLTPEIIQLRWVEKWDGQQSQTVLGSGTGAIVNLR